MLYENFHDMFVLRLQRGEELLSCLRKLCEEERIYLASVSGVGAVNHACVGLYHVEDHTYEKTVLDGERELVSLSGSVTTQGGEPYLHLHAAFADAGGSMTGGHLDEAVVSATAELFVHKLIGTVERVYDEETGLNLMEFPGLFHTV